MWPVTLSRVLALVAGCAVAIPSVGCAAATPQSTHMTRGEAFIAGQERYDLFFNSVIDVKMRADTASGEAPLRKKLAKSVGLAEDAKNDEIIDAAKTRSLELKKTGGEFFAVVAPQPKLIVKNGTSGAKGAEFANLVEDVIRQGVSTSDELQGLAREAMELDSQIASLKEDLDKSFADGNKRKEVAEELEGARVVLEQSKLRAGFEAGSALRFAVLLASAVDAGAAAELLAMEAGSSKARTQPKSASAKGGTPAKGGGKPAAGGAKPKPKPKNDFDP